MLHYFGEHGVQLEPGHSTELEFHFLNAETGGKFFLPLTLEVVINCLKTP